MERPQYIIETQRLGLRNWYRPDVEPFARINADPEVMRYFPAVRSQAETRKGIERLQQHHREHGFCFFATDLKHTGQFIGFIGLQHVPYETEFTPCVEIGWRLAKAHWGNGYATEGALACLEYAFDRLGLDEVVAFTTLNNRPSERVMQKIGMHHVGEFDHPRVPPESLLQRHLLYRIVSPNRSIPDKG